MTIALLVLFYLFFPLLILHLCHRFPFVNKLGAVIVAYLAGLLLGNIGLLPEFGKELNEYLINNPQATPQDIEGLYSAGLITSANVLAFKIYKLRDVLMSATILLAIPLLLFSSNVRQWKQLAGKTLASLFLGLIAVVVVIVLGYLIFYTKGSKDLWKVAGMLVGVYTGGTPNLAALKMMLNVDADTYILTHTYDLVVGIFYLAFLMTFGQKNHSLVFAKIPCCIG